MCGTSFALTPQIGRASSIESQHFRRAHALERNDNGDSSNNAERWFESDVLIATRRQTRRLSFVLGRDTFPLLRKRYIISDVAALFRRQKR